MIYYSKDDVYLSLSIYVANYINFAAALILVTGTNWQCLHGTTEIKRKKIFSWSQFD